MEQHNKSTGWKITTIYASADGESHFGEKSINVESTAEIGSLSELLKVKGARFRTTPATYNYDWHTAPCRQLIVNLNASVDVEVSDGERKRLGAGEVFLVEDTWGKGHKSRAVDEQLRFSLFLPLEVLAACCTSFPWCSTPLPLAPPTVT
jgi:hypothetical protein